MKRIPTIFLVAALIAGSAVQTHGYVFTGWKWNVAKVTMQLRLGTTTLSPKSIDGSTTWNTAFSPSLSAWNANMKNMQLAAGSSTGQRAVFDQKNFVYFASSAYGKSLGVNVLASAYTWSSAGKAMDSDIVFNSRWKWNSYRGNLKSGIQDMRRVAIHELGHTLGLHHPNQFGQSRVAIMNSFVTNVDKLQTDDIKGAQALYGKR